MQNFKPFLVNSFETLTRLTDLNILTSCNCPSVAFYRIYYFLFIFNLCGKPSSEMEILHLKKSIALVCLLLAGFCSSEEFEIFRYFQPSKDFFIPLSKCNRNNHTFDYCGEYNATPVNGRECFCDCDERKATFSFYKQSWSCLKNEVVRTSFGKFLCIRTFFS